VMLTDVDLLLQHQTLFNDQHLFQDRNNRVCPTFYT